MSLAQPWKKQWPPQEVAATETLSAQDMNLQASYGTHASNTKGRLFAVDKAQPWKKEWPPQQVAEAQNLSAQDMNLQASYGTHASNTKGKIFTIKA